MNLSELPERLPGCDAAGWKSVQEVRAYRASGASAWDRLHRKWASFCVPTFLFGLACFTRSVRSFFMF